MTTTAAAASGGRTGGSSATGPISVLTRTAITVGGEGKLSCRLTADSPKLLRYSRGDRVGIACTAGVLIKIARVPKTTSAAGKIVALRDGSIRVDGKRDLTCRLGDLSPALKDLEIGDRVVLACKDGVLVKVVDAPPPPAYASGELSALGSTFVTVVDGEHRLACKLASDSPATTGYRVGDWVKIRCADGVLTGMAKQERSQEKPAAVLSLAGTISALSSTSVTVHGEHDVTCSTDSPKLGDFKIGDKVKIACSNGYLTALTRLETATPSSEAKSDAKATETKSTPVYAQGAITTLNATSIAVRGEQELGCSVGAESPKLGDYKVGDKVKLSCLNGVVNGIARLETATAEPKPAPVYGQGAITALSATSIAVRGEQELSCSVGTASPKLGDYKVGDKVKLQCISGALSAIARA